MAKNQENIKDDIEVKICGMNHTNVWNIMTGFERGNQIRFDFLTINRFFLQNGQTRQRQVQIKLKNIYICVAYNNYVALAVAIAM